MVDRSSSPDYSGAGDYSEVTPRPDPTRQTTAALLREISNLDRILSSRIDAVEKAAEKANTELTRVPTDTSKQVGALKELLEEKIESLSRVTENHFDAMTREAAQRDKGVADLFTERDKSVQVALQAAEKAVGKQNEASDRAIQKAEDATTKSLDALQAIFRSEFSGLRAELSGLRDASVMLGNRVQAIEAGAVGSRTERTDTRLDTSQHTQANSMVIAYMAVGVSVLFGILSIAVAITLHVVP